MDPGSKENDASKIPFEHFDVVPEAKDNFFSTSKNGKSHPNYAKVMREWKILQENLPEDIYVQVYETRIELLRAVIIGASGTPYQDALFFFDIMLPANYPKEPPLVHYHSHGYRLNPNLYQNGLVCLSLINTWKGKKAEMWTKESSILQVLVSIQGLVLNDRPFFNEPSHGRFTPHPSFDKASYEYNETAFIFSCKTMLHTMKNPLINFEDFVAQHFRLRAAAILSTILDYKKGYMLVGQCRMNGSSSFGVEVSYQFWTTLTEVSFELKTAFDNVISGADMEKTENMMNQESEGSSSVVKVSEKIEKMMNEEGEGSSSSSKTKKRAKKWKLLKHASSKREGKEKVERKKDGIWNRIVSFAKRILK